MREPHRAIPALAILCTLSLGGCKTIRITEQTLLRPLPADSAAHAALLAALPQPYTAAQHSVPTADGAVLAALVLHRPDATQTVLYFGGNMFRVSEMGAAAVKYLAPLGVNLVLVDHRGYGGSTGTPSSIAQLENDAVVVYDAIRAMPELAGTDIVVHGQSLGSFLAGRVAEQRRLAGVVLEASATTGAEWLRYADRRPWYIRPFVRLAVDDRLRAAGNLARMRALDEPLMILVGSEDPVMPPPLARTLYESASLPPWRKRLHVLKGASHNDVPAHPDFVTLYRDFLRLVAREKQGSS
jgi:hypothetical protein